MAVEESWLQGIRLLLMHGASPDVLTAPLRNIKGITRESPLSIAVRQGNVEVVEAILEFSPDLTIKDSENRSLLHQASRSRSIEMIKKLLENKIVFQFLNDVDNQENSVLHALMFDDNVLDNEKYIVDCAKLLIQLDVDVNMKNNLGETVLFLAAKSKMCNFLKLLLDSKADPTFLTTDNRSLLHAACQAGCHGCLKHLLDSKELGAYISAEDDSGKAPFHYAIESLSLDCCELLVNNGDHLTKIDSQGYSRCAKLLDEVPSAMQLLNRLLDSHLSMSNVNEFDRDFHVDFDYSLLISKDSEHVQSSLISEINTTCQEELLNHPLLESFLFFKWRKIKFFFYSNVLLFFIFLVLHTYYVSTTYGYSTVKWSEHSNSLSIIRIFHIVMFVLIFIPEVTLMLGNIGKIVRHLETYLKVIILSTSAFVVFSPNVMNQKGTMTIEVQIAAISVLLSWLEFMLLLGRFPYFGSSILMLTRVSKIILKFIFAFSSILIGFSISFGILFKHLEVFDNFPNSFLKTLMMMIGEIDYGDLVSRENLNSTIFQGIDTTSKITYDIVTKILLILFLFLIPILMANLLIGLAVNDIPDLQKQGKNKQLSKQASYLVSYERILQFCKNFRLCPRFIRILLERKTRISDNKSIYPNKKVKKSRYSSILPTETIKNAIQIIRSEENTFVEEIENTDIGIEKQFKKFRRLYRHDRKDITDRIKILNMKIDSQNTRMILEQLQDIQKTIERQNLILQKIVSPRTSAFNSMHELRNV